MAFEFTPPPVDSLEAEEFVPPPLDSLQPMTERDSKWIKLNAERFATKVEQDIADDSSALRRVVADPAIALAKGIISVPEAAVGLADIVTKGYAGRAVEDAGFKFREAKDILSSYQTGEQQLAQGRVASAKGFIPTVKALVENPTVAAESIVESLPLMFGGGAFSQAALAGIKKLGPKFAAWAAGASAPVIAGAAGEGVVGAGSAAENIRQQSPDRLLTWEQVGYAAASGAGTAAFGALGGKVAQKLGLEDIQTALARGGTSAAQKTALPKFKAIIAGALQEGALEELPQSMQEQMFSNLALGKPWDQGLAEAAAHGFVAGAAMGGFVQLGSGRGQPPAGPTPPPLPPQAGPAAPTPAPTAPPSAPRPTPATVAPPSAPIQQAAPPKPAPRPPTAPVQQPTPVAPTPQPAPPAAFPPIMATRSGVGNVAADQSVALNPTEPLPQDKARMVSAGAKILAKQGFDPETAAEFAEHFVRSLRGEPASMEVFRTDLVNSATQSGLVNPNTARVKNTSVEGLVGSGVPRERAEQVAKENALFNEARARQVTLSNRETLKRIPRIYPAKRVEAAPPATPVAQAKSAPVGGSIPNIDALVAAGGGKVRVVLDGKEVDFDKFGLSIDEGVATVAYVEIKDKGAAGKGLGKRAYIALGEALLERGIKLQSSGALLGPGQKLWASMVRDGYAVRKGSNYTYTGKSATFIAPPATPVAETPAPAAPKPRRVAITPAAQAAAPKQTADIAVDAESIAENGLDQGGTYAQETPELKQSIFKLFLKKAASAGITDIRRLSRLYASEGMSGTSGGASLSAYLASADGTGRDFGDNPAGSVAWEFKVGRNTIPVTWGDLAAEGIAQANPDGTIKGSGFGAAKPASTPRIPAAAAPRLTTRPEASMPARPVGELGIERGRVSPVDPDLAETIEALRQGYRPQVEAQEGATAPAVVKEPWQMTAGEFKQATRERYSPQGLEDTTFLGLDDASVGKAMDWFKEVNRLTRGTIKSGAEVLPYYDKHGTNAPHRAIIESALREGKPVPPEVLADYSDLPQKAEPAKDAQEGARQFNRDEANAKAQSLTDAALIAAYREADKIPSNSWTYSYLFELRKRGLWPIPVQQKAKPAKAAKPSEEAADKDLVAKTPPAQRVDVDNGTRVQEFRVRKNTEKEMGAQWVNYYTTPWVVERRTVKRDLDTGAVEEGEWSPFARGETRQKAIEDGLGDTAFLRAESVDDTHKKAVAKELFAQEWRADKKKRLEEANREARFAENALIAVKEDANKAYKTALKRAKLFEAAGKNEADPVKIKAIQEKLQKEWFPKRDAAEVALKKAVETAKAIEAETQPPYAPQKQAPVEVLRDQPPGTPAQVAEGKPGEVSQAAGEGAKEARDKSKPEQMTPEEFNSQVWYQGVAGGSGDFVTGKGLYGKSPWVTQRPEKAKDYATRRKTSGGRVDIYTDALLGEGAWEGEDGPINPTEYRKVHEDQTLQSPETTKPLASVPIEQAGRAHQYLSEDAASKNLPVSSAAVDTYGIKLPPGYIREGELYVYRPEGKSENVPSTDVGEQARVAKEPWQIASERLAADDAAGAVDALRGLKMEPLKEQLQKLGMTAVHNAPSAKKLLERFAAVAPQNTKTETANRKKESRIKQLQREIESTTKNLQRHDEVVASGGPSYAGLKVGQSRAEAAAELQGWKDELASLEGDAQMSLGQTPSTRPAPSLSKMQVEQAVRELFDGNTPPNFQVTHNYGKVFNGREVRGWYDPATGTIWLNAAYLRSPQEARAVFIEEAFHAIQNDKAVQTELSRLVASLTPEQLSAARSAYGNISEEQLRMEAVADILEQQQLTQEQRGILARLWDAVLGAVQRLYGKFTGKVFTERDAQDVLAKALKAAAVGKRSLKSGGEVYAEGGLAAKAKAFFSRLFRTVEQSQQNKASGAQWKATIKNSKLGANLDEMALVGVNDLEDGKVYSRQEVLDYLQANQVEVKDVTLGEKTLSGKWETLKDGKSWRRKIANRWTHVWEQSDGRAIGQGPSKYNKWFPSAQAAKDYFDSSEVSAAELPTHFSTYQLPGAKEGSYREVLLTVPGDTRYVIEQHDSGTGEISDPLETWFTIKNLVTGKESEPFDTREEAEKLLREKGRGSLAKWSDGHSQYSSIANPIVRLRFNERTTQDGKRMLFLEEVQPPQTDNFEKMPALFQKNWREIAFKWALRHAAENGFEVVGWTTGQQQIERWPAVEKMVNKITWSSLMDGRVGQLVSVFPKDGGRIQIITGADGRIVQSSDKQLDGKFLEQLVGKEIAQKIQTTTHGELAGEGLKVGGEGLKKLYDVDFRNVVGKLPAVRNAGVRVGMAEVTTDNKPVSIQERGGYFSVMVGPSDAGRFGSRALAEAHAATFAPRTATIHALPVTPAIADSVMGGQAMFSTGSPQNQLDQQYFEAIQRGDMQEVQRLVEEAARAGGWNTFPMFHGTDASFTEFKYGGGRLGQGFYFASTPSQAKEYGSKVMRVFLREGNLLREGDISEGGFPDPEEDGYAFRDSVENAGYTGVDGFEETVVYSSSQIKSADPITYDDSGNIIPLSQRFQQESPDIRYSLGAPVSQSDATEVQGRAIEPSVIAAAGKAVADLGRQTVEEFEQAGRQLEGLAYESKQFRQARSELNNLVSLHEGRLRQLPQDRVTDDMRANIRDGVSIENGQIVVGDELVTKLAQMGVQARPELVKAMQAEVYFEQQARRLVDNLGKLATLKELKDYYTRIKAPDEEILKLDKLVAAKEKVVANLTPVTTNRGSGQQSIGERAGEITRATASKVELQSKRDALTLEPVQEFFGKGITELRDLSEKAKAAADLTRALMDSSTSISEVARLGEIYDKWASFDATVKDALKKGTLTDEQRVSVLTRLQQSFNEFDEAKFRMDDLLNSEEKGLLKDIRLAEADIADAKVTSGLADVLVADALKAAKGEMGLTGTVGDAANIANLEASTGAITTLAMNLGRTIDQNRWLYDFLVAPGSMPAFGASVARSLGISETALREILKVVQQSPSLASAIVTLTDDAAAKLANSPPNQMQSIAALATSGNPVAMVMAANLTSKIVQQANAQGTAAKAVQKAAAAKLAKSVLRLRTLQQGQSLFNQTVNSPAFQQLRSAVAAGASEAQKMVVLGPTGPVLRGFKSAAKEYQPELKINVESAPLELQKTREKVWKYLQNAEQYVEDYEAAAAAYAANPANPSPSQLGFDVADYKGLKEAIEKDIWPMFLNMGDMDDAARAGQYLTPVAVRKLMKAPAFIGQIFLQYEQLGKMVGGFPGNILRQQIAKYKRGYLNAKKVASQFQDLPKLQSAAMLSHNIKNEDTYRKIFNEMAHYGREYGSRLRVGFRLPITQQVVTKEDMEFFKRTLAFEERLRRDVTEIDPVTGVRYMRNGKEITRKGAYVGDKGMPRHLNRGATLFIAEVTDAYAATPKGFTTGTDLSASSTDAVVEYWNQHLGTLKQHILDSLRTDRSFKQSAEMAAAEKKIASRWLAGNMDQVNSVQDLVDLIAAEIPATTGKNPADVAVQGLNNELLQYVTHAERIQKDRADDNAKTSGLSIALSSDNEFTKPAAYLELPSEYYDYGALTSIDRITAQSRANHSALVDFANSLRLAIKELESRMGRLQKATTDKEREAILGNYKGNPQEMEDVLELLKTSLKNFEDSYRAGGPDIVPTRLGQKLLKATVGSVLAKVEIALRNLSQGQIQVFSNMRAMNYMSARLAAWKALSNIPRGLINTGYLVARNIAGFADRRLGRDPQFQRTLKGAVDMIADGIFKSAQLALLKPRIGAANVRASFERVQNLGFDTSNDWWDALMQAWIESGQFRNQLEEDRAMKSRLGMAKHFLERVANTGLDTINAFVRGSVLEASDLNMNALSLGLAGNMEQRLQEVAMVFGKRLTDAGITEIDPANKDAVLRADEWLPSMNQQTAVNSLGEIRKFLESSASSEGFHLEKSLLQYYQDKLAGKPARIFNPRTYDAVQRSMIAENNAALPTNRASAGQASTLWKTLLTLQGYPADAFLKLLRISTGGSRERKKVLQAASKISLALGIAAFAIIAQGAGDAGSELWKRTMQGKKADRVTPMDADFWSDPVHMTRAMGRYIMLSSYYLGNVIEAAYGWTDNRTTLDPSQRVFAIATASQLLRDMVSGAKILKKGGSVEEATAPLRRSITRLTFGAPELEHFLGKERDNTEAARRGITENAKALGIELPSPGFGGTVGLTNIKRKALSQAVSDMEVAKRKGDTEGYNRAKAAAQQQLVELEAYYLKQRLDAGDSPEVAAKTAKASVWGDYQENNPVTAALGGKRPSPEQYKQLVENSTGERGEVIRQGIKAWQDGAQALFGRPGNITKEDVAANRSGGIVREPSYGRVSLTGGVSGRMQSVGSRSSRGRRAKIRRVSLTGRRRRISPLRSRRKKIRRVRLTA